MVSQPWQGAVHPSKDKVWSGCGSGCGSRWVSSSAKNQRAHRLMAMYMAKGLHISRQIHGVVSCDRKRKYVVRGGGQ